MSQLVARATRRATTTLAVLAAATTLLGACRAESGSESSAAASPGANAAATGASTATPKAAFASDDQAIAAYRLDMDVVRRWQAATDAMQKAVEADPALAARLEQLDGNEDESDRENGALKLSAYAARIAAVPEAKRAIEQAGLDAEEYALVTMTLMQASMAYALLQASPNTPIPNGVNKANVEFVREHHAELEAMRAKN